eukprot:877616-Prymnesium_polylepis.2
MLKSCRYALTYHGVYWEKQRRMSSPAGAACGIMCFPSPATPRSVLRLDSCSAWMGRLCSFCRSGAQRVVPRRGVHQVHFRPSTVYCGPALACSHSTERPTPR